MALIKNNWKQVSSKLKDRYNTLTNDDLNYISGQETDLIERIRDRLNLKEDKVKEILKEVDESVTS